MGSCIWGFRNAVTSGALAAPSQQEALPISNLASPHGDTASAWQTKDGVVHYRNGACFTVDALSDAARWRLFALSGTNLSSSALVRWRVGSADGIIEPAPAAIDIDFTADPFVSPAIGTFAYARSSTLAWRCKSDGTWEEVAAGTVRVHYDPITGRKQGVLVERALTNQIRNPRGEGIAAPSTPPTYMEAVTAGGLSVSWGAQLTLDGLPGFTLRLTGTAAPGDSVQIMLDEVGNTAIDTNRTAHLLGAHFVLNGSPTGLSYRHGWHSYDTGPAIVSTAAGLANWPIPAGAGGSAFWNTTRAGQGFRAFRGSASAPGANETVRPYFEVVADQMGTFDVTLWLGGFTFVVEANSGGHNIRTTPLYPPVGAPAKYAVQADTITYTPPGGTFDITKGTICVEYATQTSWNGTKAASSVVQVDGGNNQNRFILRGSARFYGSVSALDGGTAYSYFVASNNVTTIETSGSAIRHDIPIQEQWVEVPARAVLGYGGGLPVTGAFNRTDGGSELFPTTTTGDLPLTLTRAVFAASTPHSFALTRFRYYAERLPDQRLLGLARDGVAVDPDAAVYDTGWREGLVVPGHQRAIVVAPVEVVGRAARCDIRDPANEDGFVSIALAYAGPGWQPHVSISWSSMWTPERGETRSVTRGGQEHIEPLWHRHGWNLAMNWIEEAEFREQQQALEEVAARGENVLFVADPDDAEGLKRDTVFGRLTPQSGLGFPAETSAARNWRARIVDRV